MLQINLCDMRIIIARDLFAVADIHWPGVLYHIFMSTGVYVSARITHTNLPIPMPLFYAHRNILLELKAILTTIYAAEPGGTRSR